MWYAGLDWADSHHDIIVIDNAGRQVASRRVAHSAEGLAELIAFLRQIAPLDQIACIVETNQGLLISTLLEAGCTLYPVNPKTIDRRRNAASAKTDLIDAYLLAKTGRSDLADLRKLTPDSAIIQELKALSRDQDSLVQSQTRVAESAYCLSESVLPSRLAAL